MSAWERFTARWPDLAARVAEAAPDDGCGAEVQGSRLRLRVEGQSLVSPADPAREARRWVESLAPEGRAVQLLGHGIGWELAALLDAGVPRLTVHTRHAGALRLALEHWACPQVLEDPRLQWAPWSGYS